MRVRYIAKPHATDRYQQHHPTAIPLDLVWDIKDASVVIERDMARTLLGRFRDSDRAKRGETEYRLSSDRAGIFAIVDGDDGVKFIVTYLRLGDQQKEFALKNWPRATAKISKVEEPVEVAADPVDVAMLPGLDIALHQVYILPELQAVFGSKAKVRKALEFAVKVSNSEFLIVGSRQVKVRVDKCNGKYYAGLESDIFPE
jgi:hypothetical protein